MRKYDTEFKQNAVKKILDEQSVASLPRELGGGENLLHKWKKAELATGSDLEKENLEKKNEFAKNPISYYNSRKVKAFSSFTTKGFDI